MKKTLLNFRGCFVLLLLAGTLNAGAAPVEASYPSFVRLSDHVPYEAIANATLVKHLDAEVQVPVTFTLPLRNQQALERLLQRLYDPADQLYGMYLTSEEFIDRFAPTQEDYDKVIAYAESLGLTVSKTHPNRILLNVVGRASSIESVFNLSLNYYEHTDGRKFYAPNKDPEVHVSIASVINGIVGLDNHAMWHPFHQNKQATGTSKRSNAASLSFPSGPGGGFAPNDIITAYNLTGVSAKGSGQIVALFELGSYLTSDITADTQYFGLPAAQLTNIPVDGGSTSGIDPEVALDIELALAVAPASQIYIYEGPNSGQGVIDTYNKIATDNLAKQISTSWGLGENYVSTQSLQAENAIFKQMAAQGQTIYAAAGDSGAYDDYPSTALVVDDPAAQPYMVAVGGTTITVNQSTGVYVSESVWNNGVGNGAGGGGNSKVWPIPSWQNKVVGLFSKTKRNVPDVSLNADPDTGYSIFYDGQWSIYGGTSCAAPLWAAFTARINQHRTAAQLPTLGFANPLLYAIGKGTEYTTDFHDVQTGNNYYFRAHKGYDNASGWGSFNGANLFKSLTTAQ